MKKKTRDDSAVEQILAATLACLKHQTPDQMSVMDIAKRAGVSKALLLYHFKNRDEILLSAFDDYFGRMIARIEAVAQVLGARARDDAMRGVLELVQHELGREPDTAAIFLRLAGAATVSTPLRRRLTRFRARVVDIVAGLLGAADRGDAELVVATMLGFAMARQFSDDRGALSAAAEKARALIISEASSAARRMPSR